MDKLRDFSLSLFLFGLTGLALEVGLILAKEPYSAPRVMCVDSMFPMD